jgi:hypothetical protein
VEVGTPFHDLLEYIKQNPGMNLKSTIQDALLLIEYPSLLQNTGANPDQVMRQSQETIRRLNQIITLHTALIHSLGGISNTSIVSAIPIDQPSNHSEARSSLFIKDYF